MIDVFFCQMRRQPVLRQRMRDLCYTRWRREKGARIHTLSLENDAPGHPSSQKVRRMLAENRAESNPYVVADDDCYPPNEPFLEEALMVLDLHPAYTILSMLPANANIEPWRPKDHHLDPNTIGVMEHVDVGGIRLCRPMPFKEWPEQARSGYDREQCEAIRAAGKRVGYFTQIEMLHLGEGASSVW